MITRPKFSKTQVRKAGESLCLCNDAHSAEWEIVDYWRAAHQRPLDRMSNLLQNFVIEDDESLVVCRLKRIDSIRGKLIREGHSYKLNSMYDIAGCRFVSHDIARVYEIAERLKALDEYCKGRDYLSEPPSTGYRSVHLIHAFDSPDYGYEQLKVETQVRTYLQHMWATSVEVYDVVSNNALKFGFGRESEKRYFALISALFAKEEHTAPIPGTPEHLTDILQELKALDARLQITSRLKAYSNSVTVANKMAQQLHADYVLLMIDFDIQQIKLKTFTSEEEAHAIVAYSNFERKKQPSEDAVLLKASSMDDLEKAYPNYYSDISAFLKKLDSYLA